MAPARAVGLTAAAAPCEPSIDRPKATGASPRVRVRARHGRDGLNALLERSERRQIGVDDHLELARTSWFQAMVKVVHGCFTDDGMSLGRACSDGGAGRTSRADLSQRR